MYVRNILSIAALLAAQKVSASCLHGTSLLPRQLSEEGGVEVSNFGYTGLLGPANWAALDPANIACATASVQSPINIDQSIGLAAEAPIISINNVREAEFENLGTTVEVIVNGSTLVGGQEFTLQQFHFHTPSEHRIGEEFFPVEMHMVHEAADGSGAIAVLSVLFEMSLDGSTTDLLTGAFQNLGDIITPGTVTTTGPLIFNQVVNHLQTTPLFQYTGSLTTPPCAEGLTFLVTAIPMPINVQTFRALKSVVKFNSRFTQNTLGEQNLLLVAGANAEVNAAVCGGAVNNGTAEENAAADEGNAEENAAAEEGNAEENAAAEEGNANENANAEEGNADENANAEEENANADEGNANEESSARERASSKSENSRSGHSSERHRERERERRFFSRSCRGNCARAAI